MPKLKNKLPAYRHHKASGQAVVTLNARDIYLGKHNSPESRLLTCPQFMYQPLGESTVLRRVGRAERSRGVAQRSPPDTRPQTSPGFGTPGCCAADDGCTPNDNPP